MLLSVISTCIYYTVGSKEFNLEMKYFIISFKSTLTLNVSLMDILKQNPVVSLLIKPMDGFKSAFNYSNQKLFVLIAIGSLGMVPRNFWTVKDYVSFESSFLGSCVLAMLFGWIAFAIFAAIIHQCCKVLGGKGSFKKSLTVVAWSIMPALLSLVLFVATYLIYGESFFKGVRTEDAALWFSGIVLIRSLLNLVSTFILIKGIMIGYKLSLGKSILAVCLPGVVLVAIVILPTLVQLWG